MDTKPLVEGESITLQLIKDSPTKKLVILSAGNMAPDREGKMKFGCMAELDGQTKLYRPNKTTLKNLQAKYGFESTAYVGKSLILSIGLVQGKESIIGNPV